MYKGLIDNLAFDKGQERETAGMDIRKLLGMLKSASGANGSGEYTAKCPAHQDRTASLTLTVKASPKDGKQRIYMCCHAGCTWADIMGALGDL